MDAGLLAMFVGLVSLVVPVRFLGVRTRAAASVVFAAGLLIAVTAALLPAPLRRTSGPHALLDDFVPAYQFHEFHSTRIHAPPGIVFRAIQEVTASEIRLYRTLTWIRSPHFGRAPAGVLNAPPERPVLESALRGGFMALAEDPGREIVFGTIGAGPPLEIHAGGPHPADFARFNRPGYAKIAMNFHIEQAPDGDGDSILTTETRIFTTDARAQRRFAPYWRIIYPGSSLIRVMWLGAIKRRAESHAATR